MNFQEAVSSGFAGYTEFRGRSSRAAYWWWTLFAILCSFAASIIDLMVGTAFVVSLIVAVALFLPGLAVLIRRLHDTGKSGWWWLISFVPVLGFVVLLIFTLLPSDSGPNVYGEAPDAPAV